MNFNKKNAFRVDSKDSTKVIGKLCICAKDLSSLKYCVDKEYNIYKVFGIENTEFVVNDCGSWVRYPFAYPIDSVAEKEFRRMTHYELAHWLWEGTKIGEFREFSDGSSVFASHEYLSEDSNSEIDKLIKIRVNGGEWKEPAIEVE